MRARRFWSVAYCSWRRSVISASMRVGCGSHSNEARQRARCLLGSQGLLTRLPRRLWRLREAGRQPGHAIVSGSGLVLGPSDGVLDVAQALLGAALDLLRLAPGLLLPVAGQLAAHFLDLALGLVDGAFGVLIGHVGNSSSRACPPAIITRGRRRGGDRAAREEPAVPDPAAEASRAKRRPISTSEGLSIARCGRRAHPRSGSRRGQSPRRLDVAVRRDHRGDLVRLFAGIMVGLDKTPWPLLLTILNLPHWQSRSRFCQRRPRLDDRGTGVHRGASASSASSSLSVR